MANRKNTKTKNTKSAHKKLNCRKNNKKAVKTSRTTTQPELESYEGFFSVVTHGNNEAYLDKDGVSNGYSSTNFANAKPFDTLAEAQGAVTSKFEELLGHFNIDMSDGMNFKVCFPKITVVKRANLHLNISLN